jgi:ribonuclease BN (tRNA processing enzyme)
MNIHQILLLVMMIFLVPAGIGAAVEITTDTDNSVIIEKLLSNENGMEEDTSQLNTPQIRVITDPDAENYRTKLVLLGTTGGVSWWPETDRASSSSALVVGETIYLIDLGQGSASRLSEAFNKGSFIETPGGKIEDGSSTFLNNVKVLFFTHLHMDHTADYPGLLLIGPGTGLGTFTDPVTKETVKTPIQVIGPGNRGQLEEDKTDFIKRGGQVIYTDSADATRITSTPGTRQMTELIWQAFAQTINDITLDDGYPDFRSLVKVTEIGGTEPGDIPLPVSVPDPNNETCPKMDPFEVYRDDLIRVTATLVDHHQVFPAFAYRFDTADGSVVFSGDTGPDTNGNLQKLADGADILVHEVIDRAWIDQKFGIPEPGSQMDALKTHMLESHTANDIVGMVATDCNVNTLILNHIVPGNTPDAHLLEAKQKFSGKLIIGEDLMQISIASSD